MTRQRRSVVKKSIQLATEEVQSVNGVLTNNGKRFSFRSFRASVTHYGAAYSPKVRGFEVDQVLTKREKQAVIRMLERSRQGKNAA